MKLFGSRRRAARLQKGSGKLTGVQKGMILLIVGVLVLAVTLFAVYKDFVKPMDRDRSTEEKPHAEHTFQPPTVTQTQTKVDEQTGETIEVQTEVPASHKEGFYNILVVGTDDDGTRTDTIMIARLNVKDHTVALLSIPRDTMIESMMPVPKINGAYSYVGKGEKGMDNLKSHLATLLGFEVDGYALVNLKAFVELVDLVGGVEFDVPMRMYYSDPAQDLQIDLQPGRQKLDGQKAMQLVRFRKGYATQDIQRTEVQQKFLEALAKQCLKVTNLGKIGEMSDIFMEHVTTDLTIGNIAYFGQELLKCDFDHMYTYTLEGEGVYVDGVSYYAIYLENTLDVVNRYFNPYETEITADHVTILTPGYVRYLQQQKQEAQAEEEPEEEPEELPQDPMYDWEELPADEWIEGEDPAEMPPSVYDWQSPPEEEMLPDWDEYEFVPIDGMENEP